MVEKSMLRACNNSNSNSNPSSSSLGSELLIADVKKKTKEIMGAQDDVEEAENKEESGEVKETDAFLEIDPVEKSDNVVLRKLLRGPRYFDPPDSSWGNCYNCGEAGHTIANCTAAKRKKPCFVCGSLEHNAKQCKQGKDCFICKKGGHRAKDCPEKSNEGFQQAKLCLKCGDHGHDMFTCWTVYSLDDLKEVQCYICKCFGHLCCVNYAAGAREVSCYRCGQLGHTGLNCASVNAHASAETTNTASHSSCYKCGEEGHKARKCSSSAKKRKRKTYSARFKQSHLQDNRDHVGVSSAPHDLGEARKRNKTQHGHPTSSQLKHMGGWMTEDQHERPTKRRGGWMNEDQHERPTSSQSKRRGGWMTEDQHERPTSSQSNRRGGWMTEGQHEHPTSSQSNRRGGWMAEDGGGYYRETFEWGSPSTPASYRSNNSYHGDSGYGSGSGFEYAASGSNRYEHRFSASRFGNYGRRDYGWDY